MSETGAYLYAVSRGVRADQLTDVRGIAGEQVRLVEHGGLGAVVSAVDLDEFGDEGLRRNLEDLAWLEQVARTHDAVVTQVSRLAVTAPLRLATICFDDDGVRGRLEEWQAALTTSLDRIEDRV
ncbi:MAG: GvpL/GvpF family gas vesicle protein, partial [Nocardioidaceae bacterium]